MTCVTRYALVSRGKREANNELKALLLGSNRLVEYSTRLSTNIIFFLGVMSASVEMRCLKSEKRFP